MSSTGSSKPRNVGGDPADVAAEMAHDGRAYGPPAECATCADEEIEEGCHDE